MEKNNQLNPVSLLDRELYEAPVVEIVEVRVERGFQSTGESDELGGGTPGGGKTW